MQEEWIDIKVEFDEKEFRVSNTKEKWTETFQWDKIVKVCFKSYDYGAPDFAYVFFKDVKEPCIIPIEEDSGGDNFWKEVYRRKLFNGSQEIHADTSSAEYHCWPDDS